MNRSRRLLLMTSAASVLALIPAFPAQALSAQGVVNVVKVAAGESATLYENAQFKVVGRCIDNGSGDLTMESTIATKNDDAMWFLGNDDGQDLDFDVADGPVSFTAGLDPQGTNPVFQGDDYDREVYAIASNGAVLTARTAGGIHLMNADCTFSGLFQAGGLVPNTVKVSAGNAVTLFNNKQFRVVGSCMSGGASVFTAQAYIRTKKDNALRYTSDFDSDTDFDRSDGLVPFGVPVTSATADLDAEDYRHDVYAISPGGRGLIARVTVGVHLLGSDCIFSGIFKASLQLVSAIKVAAGNTVTIFENEQFRISGTCVDNGAGDLTAQPYIKSKKDNAMFFDGDTSLNIVDFDRADGRFPFGLGISGEATGTDPDFSGPDYYNEAYAVSPGGKVLIARIGAGVHVLGAACIFAGLFEHS
jgi:hypothetical protein